VTHELKWSSSEIILTGRKKKTSWKKTCPSTNFSTTNSIWIDLSINPGLHGEKPKTNCVSYNTADNTALMENKSNTGNMIHLLHEYKLNKLNSKIVQDIKHLYKAYITTVWNTLWMS
jgi:hypothetical protein